MRSFKHPKIDPTDPNTPFKHFLSLPAEFFDAYYHYHTADQYDGVDEFESLADCRERPPGREKDNWYQTELDIIDQHYVPFKGAKVLEIGCGDGNLTHKIAKRCSSVVSWDLDKNALDVTRKRLNALGHEKHVTLSLTNVMESTDRETYDIVFFVQVLEHVPAAQQGPLFDKVYSMVAPGGCLFISTPNRWTIYDSHDSRKYFIHWFPRWFKIPIARKLNWGIPGKDPCWDEPPVLHDYVSFRWMLKRCKRQWKNTKASQMTFYPSASQWYMNSAKHGRLTLMKKIVYLLSKFLPLNYYFGSKVIFSKAR